jgi:N-acetylglucosaminyl-diphospho-decaprenol L-rhamnosyltransferase
LAPWRTYDGGVALDVAIQLVNYRTRAHLEECLPTVLADAPGALVLVLDNASGDDLSELAARHPEVQFVHGERNVGYGAGHNLLAARHDAAALLLLNPDTRFIEPRTVERLLEPLERDVHAVGPRLVSATGDWDPRDHGELHGFRARVAQAAGTSHYRRREEPVDAAWVSGACCLVAREAFDAVGGFDPEFFLYKEEEDLFLRIRQAGGRVRYQPSVTVRHDGAAVAARDVHMPESAARFADKHIRSRVQRRVMPRVHHAVAVWGGRLDRLTGGR